MIAVLLAGVKQSGSAMKDKLVNVAIALICVLMAISITRAAIYTHYWAKGVTHQFSNGDSICVIDYEIMGRDMACYAKGEK